MIRLALICAAGMGFTACASTNANDTSMALSAAARETVFTVRAAKRKSPNLFAIEDPLIQAVEARASGDYADAYNKFYAAWLATPDNEDVVLGLTDMALRTGHLETAYQAISKLELNTETAKPTLLAAQVLTEISVGQSPDIELRLNQALERAPDDPRLWNALGKFHDINENWLQAQDYYIQALKTGGSKAGLNNNLGMSLLLQGQTQAAISKFEQAINIDSRIAIYDNNRRLALALNGQFLDATKELPNSEAADILNDAGYIAKIRNDTVKAKTLFTAAIAQSDSYHPKAHENLKQLLNGLRASTEKDLIESNEGEADT